MIQNLLVWDLYRSSQPSVKPPRDDHHLLPNAPISSFTTDLTARLIGLEQGQNTLIQIFLVTSGAADQPH